MELNEVDSKNIWVIAGRRTAELTRWCFAGTPVLLWTTALMGEGHVGLTLMVKAVLVWMSFTYYDHAAIGLAVRLSCFFVLNGNLKMA
jgi:hypothetical protein